MTRWSQEVVDAAWIGGSFDVKTALARLLSDNDEMQIMRH
jgi:hypothetical protein